MDSWLEIAGVAAAGIIVAGVAILVAIVAVDAWLHLRWRRQRLAADVNRFGAVADALAERERELVRGRVAERDWSGFRSFRVTRKEKVADDVTSLYLRPHDGGPPAAYLPGQFLTLRFRDEAEQAPTVRCYTISRAHVAQEDYRITVKRLAPPPGVAEPVPWGKASSWFHSRVDVDSVVEVAPPGGDFTLDRAGGRPVVFIAGGIGITPFLAMMGHLEAHEPGREAWLFHAVRRPEEQVMSADLRRWAESADFHVLTRFSARVQTQEAHEEIGPLDIDLLKRRLPSSNYEFYVCGPPPMMSAVVAGLRDWGVPPRSIHIEAFSADTVREIGMPRLSAVQSGRYEVSFRAAGKTLVWEHGSGTILELAEQNGIFLPSGCRAGNCGTCAAPVLRGRVASLSKPHARVEEGSCLVCVSVPESDVEFA